MTLRLVRLRPVVLFLTLTALLSQPVPVRADGAEVMRFTASVLGLTAGRMTLSANRKGRAYAVTSQTASAGLAGLFQSFTVTNRVRGVESGGAFRPDRFESKADGARAGRGAEIVYKGGVPNVISMDEERQPDAPVLDPAGQVGTVDPLTMTYALLRDVDAADACRLKLEVFDGHRRSRVSLGKPEAQEGGLLCHGLYRRVDGYPPDEIAERQDFPFTLSYVPLPDGRLRPAEVVLDSLFGTARLTREE